MHCTMSFPMEIDIFKILKSRNLFFAHFEFKNDYFSSRWCKIDKIFKQIFGFAYFIKYLPRFFANHVKGVSEKYEIWCAEELGRS